MREELRHEPGRWALLSLLCSGASFVMFVLYGVAANHSMTSVARGGPIGAPGKADLLRGGSTALAVTALMIAIVFAGQAQKLRRFALLLASLACCLLFLQV